MPGCGDSLAFLVGSVQQRWKEGHDKGRGLSPNLPTEVMGEVPGKTLALEGRWGDTTVSKREKRVD